MLSLTREKFFLTQTPQSYNFKNILNLHLNKKLIYKDDDLSLLDSLNKVKFIKGEKSNFKITSQEDFSISQNADIASGTEFRIQDSTGNVGIGTANPSNPLTVAGEISSSLSGNNNSTFRSTSGGARIILDSTTNETTTGIRFAEAGAIINASFFLA